MKKILALVLALLMVATMVSLTACSKDEETDEDNDDDYEYVDTSKNTDEATEAESESEKETEKAPVVTEPVETDWITKSDYICVGVDGVALREGPGRDYKSIKTLAAGEKLKRIGTNGRWDKVSVDNNTYYVSATYTTTSVSDFVFVDYAEEDQVLLNVKEECTVNLRSTPFYSDGDATANVLFSGFGPTETDGEGESLKLIGKSESGVWYKVSFTGTWGSKTYENKICYLKNIGDVANSVDGLPSAGNTVGGPTFG